MYDPSLAPPGKHIMGIFLQYAPYTLREATWDELREPFADRVIDLIEEYAPNIRSMIVERQVLTPLDLERRFGITGGNIFHGEMSLDQMFVMRPVAGWARYRTPIRGLYLCGSGASRRRRDGAPRATTPRARFSKMGVRPMSAGPFLRGERSPAGQPQAAGPFGFWRLRACAAGLSSRGLLQSGPGGSRLGARPPGPRRALS